MSDILEKEIDSISSDTKTSKAMQVKVDSAPIEPLKGDTQLKIQVSAPSYLFSMSENDAPPFRKPGQEARPKLLIGAVMSAEEAVEMVAASDSDPLDGLRKYLATFLITKKLVAGPNISERNFLVNLLMETIDYAAQRDFDEGKLACLVTVYLSAHDYFKWYYWSVPAALCAYFKELMIRHTIEDSPDGQEVFSPAECYDALTHFHAAYVANLPLVHALTFGVHRLKFQWPFKPRPVSKTTSAHV